MTRESAAKPAIRRRRRTRQETEADLLDAAISLLRRDGVLGGITVREVAQVAGVNHGQIYEYFGSRQALLRAAISRLLTRSAPDPRRHWQQPFADRRRAMWTWALTNTEVVRLHALLALDGDTEFSLFPSLELTRSALKRDADTGAIPADADTLVMHAMTAVTYFGYCLFRETIARDLGVEPADLDRRAADIYDRMLQGLTTPRPDPVRS